MHVPAAKQAKFGTPLLDKLRSGQRRFRGRGYQQEEAVSIDYIRKVSTSDQRFDQVVLFRWYGEHETNVPQPRDDRSERRGSMAAVRNISSSCIAGRETFLFSIHTRRTNLTRTWKCYQSI